MSMFRYADLFLEDHQRKAFIWTIDNKPETYGCPGALAAPGISIICRLFVGPPDARFWEPTLCQTFDLLEVNASCVICQPNSARKLLQPRCWPDVRPSKWWIEPRPAPIGCIHVENIPQTGLNTDV